MSFQADDTEEGVEGRPTFSVIVPTHGRPKMLEEAIASVLEQSFRDWELIVVDDCSPEAVEAPPDPRIRVLRNATSLGPAAARNAGIANARGGLIAFLDDDDCWRPDRLLHALGGHGHADVVVCLSGKIGEFGKTVRPGPLRVRGRPHEWILNSTTPHLGATTIARAVCPMFDPTYEAAEDLDWWLRATRGVSHLATVPSPDWLWRRHTGPRHGVGTEARLAGSLLLLARHSEYFEAHRAARAFRWRRIADMWLMQEEATKAKAAAVASLRAHPTAAALRLTLRATLEPHVRASRRR